MKDYIGTDTGSSNNGDTFQSLEDILHSIKTPDKPIKVGDVELNLVDWLPENTIVLLPKKNWLVNDTMLTFLNRVWSEAEILKFDPEAK